MQTNHNVASGILLKDLEITQTTIVIRPAFIGRSAFQVASPTQIFTARTKLKNWRKKTLRNFLLRTIATDNDGNL